LLNIFLSNKLKLEIIEAEIFLQLQSGRLDPSNIQFYESSNLLKVNAEYSDVFTDELLFKEENGEIICERRIKNISDKTQNLIEVGFCLHLASFGGLAKDYFYHVENSRIYSKMAIPVDAVRSTDMVKDSEFDVLAGNKWIDSYDVCERIGFSPYQPFPAILLSNYNSKKGIVHGTLSQRLFFHNYIVAHENDKIKLEILSSFKAVEYREIKSNEIIEDRWYLGLTENADNIERIFEKYIKVLKKQISPLYGATDINRHSIVWGSWNDGIFRDIDEERLLKMADFILENLPTVEWMQIDDGYAKYAGELKIAHGLGAPYEENGGTDLAKFPDNLCGFTEKIRTKGINPAIWIGGHVPSDTPLGKEKPEWFFDYTVRPCVKKSSRKCSYLDVSKSEVREYMCKSLDFFLAESGFRGMKHDFWSYAFEDSHVRLANKERSGYEWRAWWLQEIRKRLPEYGYLQTGCDIVMGNPFLAEYFTNYRYGIDIGSGNWENIVTNFLWGTACFALHVGDMFVPNSDSIGLLPDLTDDEAQLCINYCLISRSMVEVAGWLYKTPDHPRMKWVKKALCCPNNGQDVYFANYDYRDNDLKGPEIWYLKTPHFSLLEGHDILPLRTVAVFNLNDEARDFSIDLKKLDLLSDNYIFTDVWSFESFPVSDNCQIKLNGRSSRLFSVSHVDKGWQILDSNIKIDSAQKDGDALRIILPHKGELELLLNKSSERLIFNDCDIDFKSEKKGSNTLLSLTLPESGKLNCKSQNMI
jgi:hypothetical protein